MDMENIELLILEQGWMLGRRCVVLDGVEEK